MNKYYHTATFYKIINSSALNIYKVLHLDIKAYGETRLDVVSQSYCKLDIFTDFEFMASN